MAGLVAYVLLGIVALRPGTGRALRVVAWVAAMAVAGWIWSVARSKTPEGFDSMLAHVPAGTVHGYRFGAGGGEMFEVTGAGGKATSMFESISRNVPAGPPDVAKLTALLECHGCKLA